MSYGRAGFDSGAARGDGGGERDAFEATWGNVLQNPAEVAAHFAFVAQGVAQAEGPGSRWYASLPALLFVPSAPLRAWARATIAALDVTRVARGLRTGTPQLLECIRAVYEPRGAAGGAAPLAFVGGGGGRGGAQDPADGAGLPVVHDPAVLWSGICCLAEVDGISADVKLDLTHFVQRAAARGASAGVYFPRCDPGADGESTGRVDCAVQFLRACLALDMGAVPAVVTDVVGVASEIARDPFGVGIGNIAGTHAALRQTGREQAVQGMLDTASLLCEYVAANAGVLTDRHAEHIVGTVATVAAISGAPFPVAELLPLGRLSASPSMAGRRVARELLWKDQATVRAVLLDPRGAEVALATAAHAVQRILDVTLEWANYLANAYVSARHSTPMQDIGSVRDGVVFPAVAELLTGLSDHWRVLPDAVRQALSSSVLPLAAMVDAFAFEDFLKFTRLDERLPPQHYTTPVAELKRICGAVDALGQRALSDAVNAENTLLTMSYLLTAQHPAAHTAAVRTCGARTAVDALTSLAARSHAAVQWVDIGLRACCETATSSTATAQPDARLKEYIADVRMAVFGRVAAAVLAGLASSQEFGLRLDYQYVAEILNSTQRCVGFWSSMGVSYTTVMRAAQHAPLGEWELSIMRCVVSAADDAEREVWAATVTRLAARGGYRADKARELVSRIFRRNNTARPAVERLLRGTHEHQAGAAQAFLAWAAGGAPVPVTEAPPPPPRPPPMTVDEAAAAAAAAAEVPTTDTPPRVSRRRRASTSAAATPPPIDVDADGGFEFDVDIDDGIAGVAAGGAHPAAAGAVGTAAVAAAIGFAKSSPRTRPHAGPAPSTPVATSSQESLVQPQYSLTMLDGGDDALYEDGGDSSSSSSSCSSSGSSSSSSSSDDDGDAVQRKGVATQLFPEEKEKRGAAKRKPPVAVAPPPAKVPPAKALPANATFIDLASRVMAPLPRMPRISNKENYVRRLAAMGGVRGGGARVEMQQNGSAWVYSAHEYGTSKPVMVEQSPSQPAPAPARSKYDSMRQADRRYQDSQAKQERAAVVAKRSHRLEMHKRCLLKALLSAGKDAPTTVTLPKLRQAYATEDDYATVIFPYVVEEATAQVRRAIDELRFKQLDRGVVVECSASDGEATIGIDGQAMNFYSDADLVVVLSGRAVDLSNLRNVPRQMLLLGKVERYYKKHGHLRLRLMSDAVRKYLPAGTPAAVQPLTKLSAVFQQNWSVNHVFDLVTARALLTSKPTLGVMERSLRHCDFMESVPRTFLAYLGRNFNASQRDAVLKSASLGEGFSLIQGPPGTGKTHTVLGLLSLLLMKGAKERSAHHKRVLLVAPSNTAIDELMARICTHGLRDAAAQRYFPKMLRVGVRDKTDEKLKNLYVEDLVDDRMGQTKNQKRDQLSVRIEELRAKENSLEDRLRALNGGTHREKEIALALRDELRMVRGQIQTEVKVRRQRMDAAHDKREECRAWMFNSAQIVCSTLGSCRNIPGNFSAVVVDEAAQAVEPDVLVALRGNAKLCVLVGDDKQLPATVVSENAGRAGYSLPLFTRLRRGGHTPFLLRTQFRMRPEIRLFPDQEFYKSFLCDHASIATRKQLPIKPFFMIDVPDGRMVRGRYSSLSNGAEAHMVVKVLKNIIQYAEVTASDPSALVVKPRDVGVITPYKDQVNYITELIRQTPRETGGREVEVNSVDGFQGREKKVILISNVRSHMQGKVGEDGGDGDDGGSSPKNLGIGFTASPERLNVMLTRGQHVVVVVCNAALMKAANPMWGRLVDLLRAQNSVYTARDFEAHGYLPQGRARLTGKDIRSEPPENAAEDPCLLAAREISVVSKQSSSASSSPPNGGAPPPGTRVAVVSATGGNSKSNGNSNGNGIDAPLRMAAAAPPRGNAQHAARDRDAFRVPEGAVIARPTAVAATTSRRGRGEQIAYSRTVTVRAVDGGSSSSGSRSASRSPPQASGLALARVAKRPVDVTGDGELLHPPAKRLKPSRAIR